jgi:FG-GAP-like repeat
MPTLLVSSRRLIRCSLGAGLAGLASLAACVEPSPEAVAPEVDGAGAATGPALTPRLPLTCNDGLAQVGELCTSAPTTVLATGSVLATVLAVDIDGDAHRDLVGVTNTRIYVQFATATGFGSSFVFQPVVASQLRDIAAGDFDGDGDLDLAATDFINDRIVVRSYTGGGLFAAGTAYATGDGPTRILAARMNADNRDDLVILDDNADTLEVRLATPVGFAPPLVYPVGNARDLALGDCDATGTVDVMYLNGTGTSTQLIARRNFGEGGLDAQRVTAFPFGATATIPAAAPLAIVAGRMNADASADAVVSAEWSRLVTGRSNGNCFFTKLPEVQTYAWAYRLRLGDHDGNGTLDVAAPHYTDPADDELSVVFGVGNGNLNPAYGLVQQPTGTVFNDAAFGDFNADGARDLVTASAAGFLLHRGTP